MAAKNVLSRAALVIVSGVRIFPSSMWETKDNQLLWIFRWKLLNYTYKNFWFAHTYYAVANQWCFFDILNFFHHYSRSLHAEVLCNKNPEKNYENLAVIGSNKFSNPIYFYAWNVWDLNFQYQKISFYHFEPNNYSN